ncbi:MAG: alkaline phosphatase D family protein [Acidimicrobiia bacterium]
MGTIDRRTLLAAGAAALTTAACTSPLRATPATTAGADDFGVATYDATGITTFAVGTRSPAGVTIRIWADTDPATIYESPSVRTGAGDVAMVRVDAARVPTENVSWQPVVDGAPGRVRALPARPPAGTATPFTFAFGACALQGEPVPVLARAAATHPLLFAWIGDLGYLDTHAGAQTEDAYRSMFRSFLASEDLRPLVDSSWFFGVQDDHDYGRDGAWRDTVQPFTAAAYAAVVPGAVATGPNWRTWTAGDVDFWLTDNRRFADAPEPGPFENGRYRSMLGAAQRDWLLTGLAASRARLKVVFMPQTFTWYFSHGEKKEITEFVESRVGGTVLFCCGDKHAGAFARPGTNVWELLACPLHNPVKHNTPAKAGVLWTENGEGLATSDAVGLVDVDPAGNRAVLRLVDDRGIELHSESIPI